MERHVYDDTYVFARYADPDRFLSRLSALDHDTCGIQSERSAGPVSILVEMYSLTEISTSLDVRCVW